jgi:hypothetical protein
MSLIPLAKSMGGYSCPWMIECLIPLFLVCVFSCPWMIKCLRTLKSNDPNYVSCLNWVSPPVLELLYPGLHYCCSYVSLNQKSCQNGSMKWYSVLITSQISLKLGMKQGLKMVKLGSKHMVTWRIALIYVVANIGVIFKYNFHDSIQF